MDNAFGLIAMMSYVATLLPTNFKVIHPAFKYTSVYRFLIKHRRSIGLWTFALSACHAGFVLYKHNPDVSKIEFYRQSLSGLSLIVIFVLLAITSNNWSIRKLRKNWKRLHSLTYVAAFLIPWHIIAKMSHQWSIVTTINMALAINIISIWIFRKCLEEWQKRKGFS